MNIDHIFITSRSQGKEADQLIEFGFLEGSNRVHTGQGTRNRKFYFENFYLEIVWENNLQELESELIQKSGLTDRVRFWDSGFSRFGLGLENREESDAIFESCEYYQPVYFPNGNPFEVLPNRKNPDLPWTFRGPFKGQKVPYNEPLNHPNGIQFLTRAWFQIPEFVLKSEFVLKLQDHPQLGFETARKPGLILEFDNGIQGGNLEFPELDLVIRY
jgi:hypothetical protein